MTDSELVVKLYEAGAAPDGYYHDGYGNIVKSDVMAGPKGGFTLRIWDPATDIAQAIEMAKQYTSFMKLEFYENGTGGASLMPFSGLCEGPTIEFALSLAVLKAMEALK